MADTPAKKKRRIRPAPQTVRERADKSASKPKKRGLLSSVVRGFLWLPKKVVGILAAVLRPLRFLLAPFRARPVRFVGRIISKILFLGYFRASWQELRQVTWPGRKQTINMTLAVFIFSLIFGVMIAIVDFGLDKLFERILLG